MSTRFLCRLTSALLLLTLGVGYAQNPVRQKVKIAQYGEVFWYLPVYVTHAKGFFAEEGLEVGFVTSGGDEKTWAALLSGDCQFGVSDPCFVSISRSKGSPGRVVASVVNGVPFYLVTKKADIPEIKEPKQLAGLSMGALPAPSTTYAVAAKFFQDGGLKPNIRQAAFGTLLPLLESGSVDMVCELEPNVSTAVKRGARVVYSFAKSYGDFAMTGVTVTEEFAQKNPQTVQRFVNALQRGIEFCRSNPEECIAIAQKRFAGVAPDVVAAAYKNMLRDNTLPESAVMSADAWKRANQLRIDLGDLKSMDDATRSFDMSFAAHAVEYTHCGMTPPETCGNRALPSKKTKN
jgi:NitT/TauT family transport system substrate-binding protein